MKQLMLPMAAVALTLGARGQLKGAFIKLDPERTYLHTHSSDTAPNASAYSLATLQILPNDFVRLQRTGDFKPGVAFQDVSVDLVGVFSATAEVLSLHLLNRLSGALDAGVDHVTHQTNSGGGEDTDIPEDFSIYEGSIPITEVIVRVPEGAEYIFFTADDSLFEDNRDPDNDWGVNIDVVPEPSAGDFDFDGDVDGWDFLKWQRGESPNPLSQSDFDAWQSNLGMVASSATATSTGVPEPTTGIMLMLGMAAMLTGYNRL